MPTVQELQDWVDLRYPDNRDFTALLSYWKNKMIKFELEQKRLSHHNHKDFIRKVHNDE